MLVPGRRKYTFNFGFGGFVLLSGQCNFRRSLFFLIKFVMHDIRVSSALLSSGLTPAQCMVYIAIRSFQGANEYSLASQRTIAETLGYNKSTVNRSIAKLLESGWVEIHANGRYIKCLGTPFGKAYEPSQSVRKKRTKQNDDDVRKKRTECTHSATEVYAFCNRDLKANNKTNNKTNIIGADKKKNEKPKTKRKRFVKPSINEIKIYFKEQVAVDESEAFFDYHESGGWKVGKKPMIDWKAAVRTWIRNDFNGVQNGKKTNRPPTRYQSIQQERQNYSYEDAARQAQEVGERLTAELRYGRDPQDDEFAGSENGQSAFDGINSFSTEQELDGIPGKYRVLRDSDESRDSEAGPDIRGDSTG